MRHPNNLIGLSFLCFLLLPSVACADPAQILGERLKAIGSMRAEFEQTTVNSYGDTTNTSQGTLSLKRDGYFLIQTKTPFPQTLVADGVDLFTFDEDLNQVVVKPLVRDVKQVPILVFGHPDQSFLEGYQVTQIDEQSYTQFLLKPQTPDGIFDRMVLKFRGAAPLGIDLHDSLGQNTQILLSNVKTNIVLADSMFEFTVPAGVDLIDDR
ncbi:MAG: outer membrane lipoprotein carrier protein [Candidatus Azotimanducaceae bacterium]|jgi:outer membrane lipoprotein carrier protein